MKPCFFCPLAVLLIATPLFAQTPPSLMIQVNSNLAELTIAADAGSPLTIESTTNLLDGSSWLVLSNFTLSGAAAILDDAGADTNAVRYYRALIPTPTNANWIAPGTFVMGSPSNEVERAGNETQHTVTLTKGFFMNRYVVTQAAYLSLMNTNPGYFNTNNGFTQDLQRPVEQVSWSDATNFCARLTQQERTGGRIFADWTYRLPTEAEWEFACRAGTTTVFYLGNNLSSSQANFNGHFEYAGGAGTVFNASGVEVGRTTAVGGYAPNSAGVYDLAGNVWEWCQDWFGSYGTNSVVDPQGPGTGAARVLRGGAFNAIARDCRSAARNSSNPSLGANTVGFRVVLVGP